MGGRKDPLDACPPGFPGASRARHREPSVYPKPAWRSREPNSALGGGFLKNSRFCVAQSRRISELKPLTRLGGTANILILPALLLVALSFLSEIRFHERFAVRFALAPFTVAKVE